MRDSYREISSFAFHVDLLFVVRGFLNVNLPENIIRKTTNAKHDGIEYIFELSGIKCNLMYVKNVIKISNARIILYLFDNLRLIDFRKTISRLNNKIFVYNSCDDFLTPPRCRLPGLHTVSVFGNAFTAKIPGAF